ncbi:MAG: futalosine hydrolase [Acidobacteriota bacterium]
MESRSVIDLAILGAVRQEVEALLAILKSPRSVILLGQPAQVGSFRGWSLLIGATGLGKVNGAITAAALLERFSVRRMWNVGCAGAYAGGPLGIGDVLIARETIIGDEGVLTRNTVLPLKTIGIPLALRNGREYYDSIPCEGMKEDLPPGRYRLKGDLALPIEEGEATTGDSFRLAYGPSLTVGMASGDPETASERFDRHGAYAESMEGSGIALACLRGNVPFMECRGMSNVAGERRKDRWDFGRAFGNCHGVVLRLLEELTKTEKPSEI